MNTEEGNKLIALFIGASKSKIDGDKRYLRFKEPQAGTPTYVFYPKNLKYHSSWDWLMPVVEKIGKMGNGWGFYVADDESEIFYTDNKKATITKVWENWLKNYSIIGLSKDLTEEQWQDSEIVEMNLDINENEWWVNYLDNYSPFKTAKESGLSFLKSLGLENKNVLILKINSNEQ